MKNKKTDYIVTTANGTRWGATGTSESDVRRNFFGQKIGLKIDSVKKGKLFSDEEEADFDYDFGDNKLEPGNFTEEEKK